MYRIFCESHRNLMRQLSGGEGEPVGASGNGENGEPVGDSGKNARLQAARTLGLLCDEESFCREREDNTEVYRMVADLLQYLSTHQEQYPAAQAFLWTLESRGITGTQTDTATEETLVEMSRLVVMLLKLIYWDEVG